MNRCQGPEKEGNASRRQEGFRLPPEISFIKQSSPYGEAYVFRHQSLGDLGRLLLQEAPDGRARLTLEVAGDPADPQTSKRAAIFYPLGKELARQLETAAGPAVDAGSSDPPQRPPESKELVESRLIPCRRCGHPAAMLIDAPLATDEGRFEDYARKMYPEFSRRNLPTWIIGPAAILKVWPTRSPIERWAPMEFNSMLDRLAADHCGS
jgi:hypothetical protein